MSHDNASPTHRHTIESGLDEIDENALGEYPALAAFTSAPRVRHRRSRHHRRGFYNLVATGLGQ